MENNLIVRKYYVYEFYFIHLFAEHKNKEPIEFSCLFIDVLFPPPFFLQEFES